MTFLKVIGNWFKFLIHYGKICYIARRVPIHNKINMAETKKIELEFPINVSPKVLFYRLSTPGGLSEWFADDVNLKDSVFTFFWDGNEQHAELIHKKDNKSVRFKWTDDENEECYFEFRISQDDLTGDVSLMITDFVEDDEVDGTTELWEKQVAELKHNLGS